MSLTIYLPLRRRRKQFAITLETVRNRIMDEEKYAKKIIDLRNKEVKRLIFDDFLRKAE